MCDFTPDIPKVRQAPPPPPPAQGARLADPFGDSTTSAGMSNVGATSGRRGLASLRIDRPSDNGLTIPGG
jgi:hypothetical protein